MSEMGTTEAEFLKAYDDLSDALFRHCYFRVYERERAKELVQETFTRTWEYMGRGNKIQNLKAFLYRTANNLVIDESRKKKTYSLDKLTEEDGFDPKNNDDLRMKLAAEGTELIGLLSDLDPAYRDILLMRYLDDLSPKDIARIRGESENAVSVRIHRGIKKAKELLDDSELSAEALPQ